VKGTAVFVRECVDVVTTPRGGPNRNMGNVIIGGGGPFEWVRNRAGRGFATASSRFSKLPPSRFKCTGEVDE
jgi:hypothetical protein